jgi:hypothetical protein
MEVGVMHVPLTWPMRGWAPAQQVMPVQQATCSGRDEAVGVSMQETMFETIT